MMVWAVEGTEYLQLAKDTGELSRRRLIRGRRGTQGRFQVVLEWEVATGTVRERVEHLVAHTSLSRASKKPPKTVSRVRPPVVDQLIHRVWDYINI